MVSIKATFSSIEKFSSDSRNEYGAINNVAADLLSRVEHYEIVVDEEKTKISRQVTRMERMYDEIQSKVRRYQSVMEKAQADRERYSEEMDYIYSHPNTVTTTDDDGNEHTESVIDYDALNAASRARDEAMSTYYTYSEKYDEATYVLHEASAMLHQCQNMKRAIELTLQAIQSDKFEIKKYIAAIGSEAEFNLQSLQGVITSLDSYLASKAIYMPVGSRYNDYSSSDFKDSIFGFGKKKEKVVEQKLKYTSKPCSETVESKEFESFKGIYNFLDTLDVSQEYKNILINHFENMDSKLKKLYNQYSDKLKCLDASYLEINEDGIPQDAAYFNYEEGGFKFSQEFDMINPLGAGNTFFHESGHMLDWLSGKDGSNASFLKKMTEVAEEDLNDTIKKIVEEHKFVGEDAEKEAIKELKTRLRMKPQASNCVSDVFGGVTYNEVAGYYVHDIKYWKDRDREAVGREAFAEFTADLACNHTESLDFIKKYLPKTFEAYKNSLMIGEITE